MSPTPFQSLLKKMKSITESSCRELCSIMLSPYSLDCDMTAIRVNSTGKSTETKYFFKVSLRIKCYRRQSEARSSAMNNFCNKIETKSESLQMTK